MSQNTKAVQNDEKAYTSASTAENQKVSLHVYANAPHTPPPKISSIFHSEMSSASSRTIMRRTRCVIVQNNSKIVAALSRADMALTAIAAWAAVPPNRVMKNRAHSMKMGLPGG